MQQQPQAEDVELVEEAVAVGVEESALAVRREVAARYTGELRELLQLQRLSHHPMV
jgi:hypothetical protein